MMSYVLWLEEISREDTSRVGGKSANLGELASMNVPVLPGFTTTSEAYDFFLEETDLKQVFRRILNQLDTDDVHDLSLRGKKIREAIKGSDMPSELKQAIADRYQELADRVGQEQPEVAVRSSATAEDQPGASFAGQQDTYLNVTGEKELIKRVKDCFASLFTNRAISYREDKDYDHFDVKLSVAVQLMGNASQSCSGVIFTLDPDSGFEDVITINASYGLGEAVVQGEVNPDEYIVFKPTDSIIEKKCGDKENKIIRTETGHTTVKVDPEQRQQLCLTEDQILQLADYASEVEDHYEMHMDLEWLLDGETNELYIIQARPETVHSQRDRNVIKSYKLEEESEILLTGAAVGSEISCGKASVLNSPKEIDEFEEDRILVTDKTDPDWEPIMKKATAIVTNKGGRTSHAAIVSRELGIPAVVGTERATSKISAHQPVTVDCASGEGRIWRGQLDFEKEERSLEEVPDTETEVLMNIGEPSEVFSLAQIPVDGVGLVREEFIISSYVGEHPLHLIEQDREDKYLEALKYGVGKIAAAFYPREVVVRLSDFKSDEYSQLEGGSGYEPEENNPMLGWRGASRYYSEEFEEAFELECTALRQIKAEMGLTNIVPMVPFCRTPEEGRKVKRKLEEYDLGDKVYVMAEVPSNIVLAEDYAQIFDGFSIGSNDLTQLTLGIDRNSDKLSYLFDERNPAVKRQIASLIKIAHSHDCKVGICGDAPSTYSDYTQFLVEEEIDSISVSPDVALKTILRVNNFEGKYRDKKADKEEISAQETVQEAANELKSALEDYGELDRQEMKGVTSELVSSSALDQALGWLIAKGQVRILREGDQVKYSLSG